MLRINITAVKGQGFAQADLKNLQIYFNKYITEKNDRKSGKPSSTIL